MSVERGRTREKSRGNKPLSGRRHWREQERGGDEMRREERRAEERRKVRGERRHATGKVSG